jgi:lipid A oxidase
MIGLRTGSSWTEADRGRRAPWLHAIAGLSASLLLIMAAAMPSDDDSARAASASGPASAIIAPGRETNLGAYLGAPYHYPSDFRLVQDGRHDFTIKQVEWFTLPFKNPLYYGARVQRWSDSGRFGTMIDFLHSKAYSPFDKEYPFEGTLDGNPAPATGKIKDYFSKLEWTHGHNMLTLNGLMRFGMIGSLSPYAGLGAGISLPHSEIHLKTDPARTYEYQYTGPTAQALFGIEWRLRTGSLFIEYKFTFADYWGPITHTDGSWLPLDMWRQFSRWWTGTPPPGGWAGAKLSSHQVVGGFTARFKPATP